MESIRKEKNPERYLKLFHTDDRLGSLLGCRLISISETECIAEYDVNPEHYNPNGILHGGALYSVMDSAQGAFIHYTLDEQFQSAATGTATIRYHAPLTSGTVRIRTFLKGTDRRKIFITSQAFDADGKEVATLEEIWIGILKP